MKRGGSEAFPLRVLFTHRPGFLNAVMTKAELEQVFEDDGGFVNVLNLENNSSHVFRPAAIADVDLVVLIKASAADSWSRLLEMYHQTYPTTGCC